MRRTLIALLAALALACGGSAGGPAAAAAKGLGWMSAPGGIALPGSPFRYQAFSPGNPGEVTVVTRANREGGKVGKWWSLRGEWIVPAVTPSVATGLSADGGRLVLVRRPWITPEHPAPDTRLAIMRPQLSLRHAPNMPRPDWVDFVRLPGEWGIVAISPDGRTLFLSRFRNGVDEIRPGLFAPHAPGTDDLEVRALDTATGALLPGRVRDDEGGQVRLEGIAYDQVSASHGRWTYTLYAGDRRRPFVYALDGFSRRGTRIDLPHLRGLREPYALHLELEDAGRSLAVVRRWFPDDRKKERTLAIVDTATFHVRRPQRAQAYASSWVQPVGRAADGREVRLKQLGDPALDGRLLVFNCSRDDCASRGIEPLTGGCPDPDSNIYVVPTLHSDPGMARRIERLVEPEATIWLDLPPGRLGHRPEERLEKAIVRLGREVGKD